MNFALILAGGSGTRVGYNTPKQFIDIFGKPVIYYTLEVFEKNSNIDGIGIVCVESYLDKLKQIVIDNNFTKVKFVTPGGCDFQHSVMNGVKQLENVVKDDDIILVHYAASPFVTDDIINDAISVCIEKGNCVSATNYYLLTGNNVENSYSDKFVDRDKIIGLNSPQSFKYSVLKEIYQEGEKKQLLDKVEPHTTSLMFALNKKIYFSYGNQTNIKITTKEDLELFKGWVLLNKLKNKD